MPETYWHAISLNESNQTKHCSLTGETQSSLSSIGKDIKSLPGLIDDELCSTIHPLSNRCNVVSVSLLYLYYSARYPDKLHYLVLPAQISTTMTRHEMLKVAQYPHFPWGSVEKKKCSIQTDSSPRTFTVYTRIGVVSVYSVSPDYLACILTPPEKYIRV